MAKWTPRPQSNKLTQPQTGIGTALLIAILASTLTSFIVSYNLVKYMYKEEIVNISRPDIFGFSEDTKTIELDEFAQVFIDTIEENVR